MDYNPWKTQHERMEELKLERTPKHPSCSKQIKFPSTKKPEAGKEKPSILASQRAHMEKLRLLRAPRIPGRAGTSIHSSPMSRIRQAQAERNAARRPHKSKIPNATMLAKH